VLEYESARRPAREKGMYRERREEAENGGKNDK
jgi:hypothetical protein